MTEVLAHTAGYGGLHGWASQAGTAQLVRQNASSAARCQPAIGFAVQLSPGTDQSLDGPADARRVTTTAVCLETTGD